MKRKRLLILGSIAVVSAILITAVLFLHDISDYSLGVVTKVSAKVKSEDKIELKMKYVLPSGGYSVREVPEDEGEYIGDGMIDYDGSLGKYRIMVEFGDIEPHDKIARKLSSDGYLELMDSPIKMRAKITSPSDHGFVLYIGSDTPIHIEEFENGEFDRLGGTLRIPITIDAE